MGPGLLILTFLNICYAFPHRKNSVRILNKLKRNCAPYPIPLKQLAK